MSNKTDNHKALHGAIEKTDNRIPLGSSLETKQCNRPKEPLPQPKEVNNSPKKSK